MGILCSILGHKFIEHKVYFWHCRRCCTQPEIFKVVSYYPNGYFCTEYADGANNAVEYARGLWVNREKNGIVDVSFSPTKLRKA